MKKALAGIGLMAGWLIAGAAHAQVGVTGDIGSTGVGTHATLPLAPNLNVRLGANYLSYIYSSSTSSLDYDLKLKTNTYDALLDWYPIEHNAFRVTAGIVYNGNNIDVHAKSNAAGNYTISGRTYDASSAGKVDGKVDFRKTAPYLGIGWGNAAADKKGWSFSTDVGVLFQGAPNVTLANSGCTAPAPVCTQFASDVAREKAALTDDVSRFKAYPVLRIGINYRF